MDINWDDLRTVLWLVRGKTLAAAAEALGVNYTTVSRRVLRAETAAREPLFERLADGYRPTEAGLLVAKQAEAMEVNAIGLARALGARDSALSGPMTITAPQLLIASFLAPVIDQFCATYPDIALRVRATNTLLDLNRREADLAIRISDSPGDTLKGLRLSAQHNASYATKEWAGRISDDPGTRIDWITYEHSPGVPKAARQAYPNSRVRLCFDDMVAMVGAARAGLGVVRLPMFLGRTTPDLVQVPVLPPQVYSDIWLVAHPDVWPGAKLKAFREVLIPYFRRHRSVFVA